jgi:hypothetical protein
VSAWSGGSWRRVALRRWSRDGGGPARAGFVARAVPLAPRRRGSPAGGSRPARSPPRSGGPRWAGVGRRGRGAASLGSERAAPAAAPARRGVAAARQGSVGAGGEPDQEHLEGSPRQSVRRMSSNPWEKPWCSRTRSSTSASAANRVTPRAPRRQSMSSAEWLHTLATTRSRSSARVPRRGRGRGPLGEGLSTSRQSSVLAAIRRARCRGAPVVATPSTRRRPRHELRAAPRDGLVEQAHGVAHASGCLAAMTLSARLRRGSPLVQHRPQASTIAGRESIKSKRCTRLRMVTGPVHSVVAKLNSLGGRLLERLQERVQALVESMWTSSTMTIL